MLNTIVGFLGEGAPATDYESIQTVTVGSGGASSISFTSIPSTYSHLQIRGIARSTNSGDTENTFSTFNGDTASNYAAHYITGNGSTVSAGAIAPWTQTLVANLPAANISSGIFGVMIYDVLDYANTNKFKTLRSLYGNDRNGAGSVWLSSGLWRSTSAISTITFTTGANFAQYSSFALYGIK